MTSTLVFSVHIILTVFKLKGTTFSYTNIFMSACSHPDITGSKDKLVVTWISHLPQWHCVSAIGRTLFLTSDPNLGLVWKLFYWGWFANIINKINSKLIIGPRCFSLVYPTQLGPTDHVIRWALKLGRSSHRIPSSAYDCYLKRNYKKNGRFLQSVSGVTHQVDELDHLKMVPLQCQKGQWALRTLHAIWLTLKASHVDKDMYQKLSSLMGVRKGLPNIEKHTDECSPFQRT